MRLGLVELGFGSSPWGSQAVIDSCQFRDCKGFGLSLKQNISLIEKTYVLRCGTAVRAWGNHLSMNHCQILGATEIDIRSPCILRNLEIESPLGKTALNVCRKALISDIHISLSQSIDTAIEFEQKAGYVRGFLFDAKPGAKCLNWLKYPRGAVQPPVNIEFGHTEVIE